MISFGMAILPMSCSRAPNSRLRRAFGIQPQPLADGQGQADDALGVLAGIAIVGGDHIAEQQRGAAIGVVELEQTSQPLTTLTGEHRQQPEQGDTASTAAGVELICSATTSPTPDSAASIT